MQIKKNSVVNLHYDLKLSHAEGELVESDEMTFLVGHKQLLDLFEENIANLSAGDTFSFPIGMNDAYGPVDPDATTQIPRAAFEGYEDLLFIGSTVPMRGDDGQLVYGTISQLGDAEITMDFNHPMAGKDLHFSGHIISVREATEEEISHGHVHGDGGVHH